MFCDLQRLIEATLKTPNNPYIATDKGFWPPYVDLLINYDIAVAHPDDSTKIKLAPFHL